MSLHVQKDVYHPVTELHLWHFDGFLNFRLHVNLSLNYHGHVDNHVRSVASPRSPARFAPRASTSVCTTGMPITLSFRLSLWNLNCFPRCLSYDDGSKPTISSTVFRPKLP